MRIPLTLLLAALVPWTGRSTAGVKDPAGSRYPTVELRVTVTGTFASTGTASDGVVTFMPGGFDVVAPVVEPGDDAYGFANEITLPGNASCNLGQVVLTNRTATPVEGDLLTLHFTFSPAALDALVASAPKQELSMQTFGAQQGSVAPGAPDPGFFASGYNGYREDAPLPTSDGRFATFQIRGGNDWAFQLLADGPGSYYLPGQIVTHADPEVALPQGRKGDVNGDGRIDLGDVLLALELAIGKLTSGSGASFWAADVAPSNPDGSLGDGKVGIDDAIRILRYAVGIESSLSAHAIEE